MQVKPLVVAAMQNMGCINTIKSFCGEDVEFEDLYDGDFLLFPSEGGLLLHYGDYLVKLFNGEYEVRDEDEFESNYEVITKNSSSKTYVPKENSVEVIQWKGDHVQDIVNFFDNEICGYEYDEENDRLFVTIKNKLGHWADGDSDLRDMVIFKGQYFVRDRFGSISIVTQEHLDSNYDPKED